jgi:uncharacterized membrane protein
MLTIIGLIAVIIATYFTYKTANDNGRSGPLWALATFGVGFGLQFIVPILIGIVMGVILISSGMSAEDIGENINGIAAILGIVLLFLSFIGIWLIMRHVAKLPEDVQVGSVPPPPTFDQNE